MDITQPKQRIDASGKKLVTLGNEYIKPKDEIAAQKLLVKMLVVFMKLLLGEQNAQMDRISEDLNEITHDYAARIDYDLNGLSEWRNWMVQPPASTH